MAESEATANIKSKMNANARSFSWSLCYKTRKDQISDPWLAITYVTNKVFLIKVAVSPNKMIPLVKPCIFYLQKKAHRHNDQTIANPVIGLNTRSNLCFHPINGPHLTFTL